jgi:hypothetical protein
MKYVIWGAGERGRRIFPHIGEDNVIAFIDVNSEKIGNLYLGKQIISFDKYKELYSEFYIVISYSHEEEVVDLLVKNGIYRYFLLSECPGEFQESNPRTLLKEYICKNVICTDKKYAIYGCTLYSLILNQWIKEVTGEYAVVISHSDFGDEILEDIRVKYGNQQFISYDDLENYHFDELLVTYEKDMCYINKLTEHSYSVKNIYDCSDFINEYYNPQIEKFQNINYGKRCFIVATGPSLKMEDLDVLEKNNEICFSMNRIWYAFHKTKWRPDYYVIADYRFLKEDDEMMEELPAAYKFVADTYAPYWEKSHKDNIIKYHYHFEYVPKGMPKFSEDISRKSYHGCTVTYNCIQLAIYMGFKEIYLLGVDATVPGKYHDDTSHFCKDYISKSKTSLMCFIDEPRLAYRAAKEYAENKDITIYNATRGGQLEVFQRVNFDELF